MEYRDALKLFAQRTFSSMAALMETHSSILVCRKNFQPFACYRQGPYVLIAVDYVPFVVTSNNLYILWDGAYLRG